MGIEQLIQTYGNDALFMDDDRGLVVIENFGGPSEGEFMIEDYAHIVLCTDGTAQFDYDGQTVHLQKNDLFVFIMLHSKVNHFKVSPDFNCRQLWFTRNQVWNIDMYGKVSLPDLMSLRQHPKVTLSEGEAALMDAHFMLLCRQLRERHTLLYSDIVRSQLGTIFLKTLSLLRSGVGSEAPSEETSSLHYRQLANRFIELVEQSDGRVRRVEVFASQLNVTPKYLLHLLRETMNRRPSEIIAFFTMKAIEHRLRFTSMTIQQIAYDLHFANPSFFGKYFREHTGMTPMEYRTKYQKLQ